MPENAAHAEDARSGLNDAREHFRAARASMRARVQNLVPPGFIEHRRAARKEMLLSLRSLIDAAIEHAEGRKG